LVVFLKNFLKASKATPPLDVAPRSMMRRLNKGLQDSHFSLLAVLAAKVASPPFE
jgi:hypothetical protein